MCVRVRVLSHIQIYFMHCDETFNPSINFFNINVLANTMQFYLLNKDFIVKTNFLNIPDFLFNIYHLKEVSEMKFFFCVNNKHPKINKIIYAFI